MPPTLLTLRIEQDRLNEFFGLLQQGFRLVVQGGCNLEELLCTQWGISSDYARARITTVFVDSRAIDDLGSVGIRDGSVIALSGAMPGLVGATMRRGGYYAAMRGAMTYRSGVPTGTLPAVTVRVKLFNLLLPELGPAFLRRGILLEGSALLSFLEAREPWFWQGCRRLLLEGQPVDQAALFSSCQALQDYLLKVEPLESP